MSKTNRGIVESERKNSGRNKKRRLGLLNPMLEKA